MKIPNHIAFIMDGNRRWGYKNNVDLETAYKKGANNATVMVEYLFKYGVQDVSFWVFSVDNHKRSSQEKNIIFNVIEKNSVPEKFFQYNIRIIGSKNNIPESLNKKFEEIQNKSNQQSTKNINLFFNYSGSVEIIDLFNCQNNNNLFKSCKNFADLKKNSISKNITDIDMIIRTGGQKRLSNFSFLLTTYSEIIFNNSLWPDFTIQELQQYLHDYNYVNINFGQ